MPLIDEQTLKGQIKENKFQTSYLIYGSEAYLKQYYANLIASKCVSKDMEGFNLRKFDAENNNDIRELMEATDTLPVFSEYTCTLMKNFALDSMYSQDKTVFEEWLKNMPETTVAVFWQDTTEINPKKNAKWKSVIELFNKYGAVLCLDTMDRNSLAKTVAGGLKKRGKEIDRVTAFYLIDTVGDDLNILLNEVDKLANYCQGESVTKADIDAVCIKSLEANVFDLSKSLVGRNLSRCYHILNKLFEDKEKPEMILGALCGNFIDMYRVKLSLSSGKSADYLKAFYNYKNTEFKLRNAQRDCSRIELSSLKKCIELLSEADGLIKLRTSDEKIVLEKLMLELYKAITE